MRVPTAFALSVLLCTPLAAQPDQRLELRNLGLAQLENERAAEAEETFGRLLQLESQDPLPAANLAIALLRQQKGDRASELIDLALQRAPDRGDLLAVKGDVLIWTGQGEAALDVLLRAAEAEPQDPQILYALYRHASTLRSDEAEAAATEALRRLADLRPENLVVLLKLGQLALEEEDRATASRTYLRLQELIWQAQPVAATTLEQILQALEADDLETAKVPSLRLENVLKITPMFKSSLAELYNNVQGMPVSRFAWESSPTAFGDPLDVRFAGARIEATAGVGRALVVVDLDGDERPDIGRIVLAEENGEDSAGRLEIRSAKGGWLSPRSQPAPASRALLPIDLDNDGRLDLVGYGSPDAGVVVWRQNDEGALEESTALFGLSEIHAGGLDALDFDSEGDLDLAVALDEAPVVDLYRNRLEGSLERIGDKAIPPLRPRPVHALLSADLDRDGDTDLLLSHANGVTWLDNLRQGRFANRTALGGLRDVEETLVAASADLDNDGLPDLLLAAEGIRLHRNLGGVFQLDPDSGLPAEGAVSDLVPFDADNDGRLDVAAVIGGRLVVLGQRDGRFQPLPVDHEATGLRAVDVADLDEDGDLDLVASGPSGLLRLENQGGNRNHWLSVRLRGLTQGNDKNNVFGRGATAEVRLGAAYQYREVRRPVTHFGLGGHERADSLRVVWANGVPQHRIHPEVDQLVVEEQVLKGSCPFLYTWNGDEVVFVTDLLWGAPLGMPVGPGVWAGADPQELVKVEGAVPREGVYDLRITEELWEAAFFDYVRLWVVDHPPEVEVASSLRVVPGRVLPDEVLATRHVRPVVEALDGAGRDVTDRVARRDEVYADGYPVGDYQGVADVPWSLVFDLGEAPARSVRLLLDGWIFPADASLNLAVAQRTDLPFVETRLEVETEQGWVALLDPMGFPAGKTKTTVIDTPPLPPGAQRLRITTSRWLSYDRIAWSLHPADEEARVVARLEPRTAELRFRGFSRMLRVAPNAPHTFDYQDVSDESPWLPFPGRYTRFGDVRPLLFEPDDRTVILAAGDELLLTFEADSLPPPAAGLVRTVFLESHGWDKDADRNTWEATQVEPLPFRAMSGYPWGPTESYPKGEPFDEYRRTWLTREIEPAPKARR